MGRAIRRTRQAQGPARCRDPQSQRSTKSTGDPPASPHPSPLPFLPRATCPALRAPRNAPARPQSPPARGKRAAGGGEAHRCRGLRARWAAPRGSSRTSWRLVVRAAGGRPCASSQGQELMRLEKGGAHGFGTLRCRGQPGCDCGLRLGYLQTLATAPPWSAQPALTTRQRRRGRLPPVSFSPLVAAAEAPPYTGPAPSDPGPCGLPYPQLTSPPPSSRLRFWGRDLSSSSRGYRIAAPGIQGFLPSSLTVGHRSPGK